MIKTTKEILLKEESGKVILIPAGTYLENREEGKWFFTYPDASHVYMDSESIEKFTDRFAHVSNDEPEIYEIIRKFSDLLDRQDIKVIVASIEETDPETMNRIYKFFGTSNIKELEDKVKDLETQLFAERMKQWTSPHTPINPLPNPYVSQPITCQTCGIDFSKNTNYVCMNSACPSRTIWCSTSTDTTNTFPAGSNASYTIKKDEEE
jgi:predicted Zn-ribbon and HTH transcriptional regulator